MERTANWISIWSRSQRGMGLVSHLFQEKQKIQIKVPAAKAFRFRFSTWYEEEAIELQDVYLKTKHEVYPILFSKQKMFKFEPQTSILSDEVIVSQEITEAVLTFTIHANKPISSAIQLMEYDIMSAPNNLVYLLNGIEIKTRDVKANVGVIGDSITEQGMWSVPLADWLFQQDIGLLNHGISGNRLCKAITRVQIDPAHTYMFEGTTMEEKEEILGWHTGISLANQCFGKAGYERFQKEILEADKGTKLMLFALGTNDLYQPGTFCASMQELITFDEFMSLYRTLFEQAKKNHIKTFALSIPSFQGTDAWTKEKEELRLQINQQLAQEPLLDGVISFDEVLCDKRGALKDEFHNGDHLHPNSAGGRAMAEQIQKELSTWIGYLES